MREEENMEIFFKAMKNIVCNLSDFKRKVYKCPGGLHEVVTNCNQEGLSRIEILGNGVSFFRNNPSGAIVSASYSNEHGLPESIKFYNPDDDTFYCFENVRRVYEEAAYEETDDDDNNDDNDDDY